MTNKYQEELYEKMNAAFNREKKENTRKEILKLEPNKTYVVRLIPNLDDPTKTFLTYYTHGWLSEVDGKFISSGCPTTLKEEGCPICREYFKLYKKNTTDSVEMAKRIKRIEKKYVNVYVIDDPVNPENNNTVKILRYGQQLDKIINQAWDGDDKDIVGARMFEFSDSGCNLRIKVEKNQGDFPTYTSSKFLPASPVAVTIDQIKDQLHNLDTLVRVKSLAELQKMLDEGLYGTTVVEKKPTLPTKQQTVHEEDDNDIPMTFPDTKKSSENDDLMSELETFLEKG